MTAADEIDIEDRHFSRAYTRIKQGESAPPKVVTEFLGRILEIDEYAIELRQRASNIRIGLLGRSAYRSLTTLEEEYNKHHDQLIDARKSLLNENPSEFSQLEFDNNWGYNHWRQFEDLILEQINSTFNELEKTRSLISAKRSTSVTRMSVVVSTGILFVSACALVLSLASQSGWL